MVSLQLVGTPRCGVPVRVERTEIHPPATRPFHCAAERGAVIAARWPYRKNSNCTSTGSSNRLDDHGGHVVLLRGVLRKPPDAGVKRIHQLPRAFAAMGADNFQR